MAEQRPKHGAFESGDEVEVDPAQELTEPDAESPLSEDEPRDEPERDGDPQKEAARGQEGDPGDKPNRFSGRGVRRGIGRLDHGATLSAPVFFRLEVPISEDGALAKKGGYIAS